MVDGLLNVPSNKLFDAGLAVDFTLGNNIENHLEIDNITSKRELLLPYEKS